MTKPQFILLRKLSVGPYRNRKRGEWVVGRKLIELGWARAEFPALILTEEGKKALTEAKLKP